MTNASNKSGPSLYLIIILIILIPISLIGPNMPIALLASLVLVIGYCSLWRPDEPLALLFVFGYQWIQVNILAFYGNIRGMPLTAYPEFPGDHERAIVLANIGLLVLGFAIRFSAGRPRHGLGQWLKTTLATYPAKMWILAYVAVWIFSSFCAALAPYSGGLRQPLLVLAELKWAAFLLLTASTFAAPGRSKIPLILAASIELVMSIGGFFGEFRAVFFYSIIGISFFGSQLIKKYWILTVICVMLALLFAVSWSAVKTDYRDYISNGVREQVVLVGYGERMQSLFERIAALDAPAMAAGADKLVRRISYFEFFGVVLRREQLGQPSTGGEIWGGAAISPFMPRLLFPDKPVVDDTKLTTKYTGINPAAWSSGVSVSMGYMAEAFLDFGSYFMFVAIGALGLMIGTIYRWLMHQRGMRLVMGVGLAPMLMMQVYLLEISILKLLPALALSFLSCWVTLNFLGPLLFSSVGLLKLKAPTMRAAA